MKPLLLMGDLMWSFSALPQWRKTNMERSLFFILSASWYFLFPSGKQWIEELPYSPNQNKGFLNYVFLCISLLLSVFVYPILSVSTILNVFHNMFDKRHDKLLFRLLYRLNSMQTNELHNPLWLCVLWYISIKRTGNYVTCLLSTGPNSYYHQRE